MTKYRERQETKPAKPVSPPIRGIDHETERLMQNWARWKAGASVSLAISSAYDPEARGAWGDTPMPLIDGDAELVDEQVEQLPDGLKIVVIEYWVRGGRIEQKVTRCRCTLRTFWRRLAAGNQRVVRGAQERRRAFGRAHAARSGKLFTPRVAQKV